MSGYVIRGKQIVCYLCGMIIVPTELPNRKSYSVRKKRFHIAEYTSSRDYALNDVLMSEHTIVYVLQGRKVIHIDGAEYEINSGELFLLPKGKYIMSEYLPQEGAFRSVMLFFNRHLISEILYAVGENMASLPPTHSGMPIHVIPCSPGLSRLYESLQEITSGEENIFQRELLELKIKELIYTLLATERTRVAVFSFLRQIYHSESHSIATVVNDNLYNKTSVEALAMLSCMSVSTFKREFTKEFGTSPIKYINDKRLEKALLLVRSTRQNIGDIAYECGFESYVHFSRCFKSKYGKTANEIRANM